MYCHEKGCRLHDFGRFSALCLTSCTMGESIFKSLGWIESEGRDNAPVKWDTITITVDRSSSISD